MAPAPDENPTFWIWVGLAVLAVCIALLELTSIALTLKVIARALQQIASHP